MADLYLQNGVDGLTFAGVFEYRTSVASPYVYSISTDFVGLTGPEPVLVTLTNEVAAASAGPSDGLDYLTHVERLGDEVRFYFELDLSAGEITTLDGVVAAHLGAPIPLTFEEEFAAAKGAAFKTLIYLADGTLDQIDSFADAAKTDKTYNQALTYSVGALTKLRLTRVADGAQWDKDLTYDGEGNLVAIAVTEV